MINRLARPTVDLVPTLPRGNALWDAPASLRRIAAEHALIQWDSFSLLLGLTQEVARRSRLRIPSRTSAFTARERIETRSAQTPIRSDPLRSLR